MDFINEGIALSIDLIILGCCVKQYINAKNNLNCLKAAQHLPVDSILKSQIQSLPEKKVPYALIRGTVEPIGLPLRSTLSPGVSGVLQVMKLREHRICRTFSGFWIEQENVIRVTSNETPFKLQGSGDAVKIINPFSANVLDLDIIYNNSQPYRSSYFDHVMDFLSGVRQKEFQTTEEMLRTGTVITAIGELELDGENLVLQPSPTGPFILSSCTKETLMQRFEDAKSSCRVRVIIFGVVATALVGFIVRKLYLHRKKQREERQMKDILEKERRSRRALTRSKVLNNEQLCVACSTNPKEIIILPCGHVCLCEDCAEKIQENCPVCRGKISKKAAAFI